MRWRMLPPNRMPWQVCPSLTRVERSIELSLDALTVSIHTST